MSATKKLAALKDLAAKQDQELEHAFDAGSSSQQEFAVKGVGTFRVDESDRLLRKKAPQRTEGVASDTLKLAGIVITAAGLAIFLLWLLFSGSSPQTAASASGLGYKQPPMNATELQKAQPGNSCPEPSWLPEQCIGAGRLRSKKVFDECQQYFDETGFNLELLAACGILTKDTP